MCSGVFGIRDEVGRSLFVLAVERSFLCSFLRSVSCGWEGGGVSGCFGSREVISLWLLVRCGVCYFGVFVVESLSLCSFLLDVKCDGFLFM